MTVDDRLVETIVSQVLRQLDSGTSGPRSTPSHGQTEAAGVEKQGNTSAVVSILEKVITEDVLAERVGQAQQVVFGSNSVITPSGRDYLAHHGLQWRREEAATSGKSVGCQWRAVVVESAETVQRVLRDHSLSISDRCTVELVDNGEQAAQEGIGSICRGQATMVLAFSDDAELVACLANRNSQVRAAVVNDAEVVERVARTLNANLLVIPTTGRSYFQLRRLVLNAIQRFPQVGSPDQTTR